MPERIYKGAHASVEIEEGGKPILFVKGGPAQSVSAGTAEEMDRSDAWGKPSGSTKSKEKE